LEKLHRQQNVLEAHIDSIGSWFALLYGFISFFSPFSSSSDCGASPGSDLCPRPYCHLSLWNEGKSPSCCVLAEGRQSGKRELYTQARWGTLTVSVKTYQGICWIFS